MLEKLRQDSWGKDARVVVLTNLSEAEKVAKAAEHGVNDYLVKADWDIAGIVEKVRDKVRENK
jgi:PleD family two-component response regulator